MGQTLRRLRNERIAALTIVVSSPEVETAGEADAAVESAPALGVVDTAVPIEPPAFVEAQPVRPAQQGKHGGNNQRR